MARLSLGVLRGGPSSEYEVSLKTGAAVLRNLPEEKYHAVDVLIDREGVWHISGMSVVPERALQRFDALFNALHGEYGEDGGVQELLDDLRIPYTGSRQFSSRLAMNKVLAKSFLKPVGVKTPYYRTVKREEATGQTPSILFRTFPQPSVIKPLALGSSVGVSIARTEPELEEAMAKAFERSETILIEEYIAGREATGGVVERFRGDPYYALLPTEITVPNECLFFDYEAKYSGRSKELCPGTFSEGEKAELQRLATVVHRTLGLRHYSRSDFIVHPRRGIYFLEVNTLPGLTEESLLPKALAAVGCSFPQFLDHVITLAYEDRL